MFDEMRDPTSDRVLGRSLVFLSERAYSDAADFNDDGSLNTSDSVGLLNFLRVSGGVPPVTPGPIVCGPDPTLDPLPPYTYTSCAVATPIPNSRFIRGDCDLSLSVTIADAIAALNMRFGLVASCVDRARHDFRAMNAACQRPRYRSGYGSVIGFSTQLEYACWRVPLTPMRMDWIEGNSIPITPPSGVSP